MTEKPSALGHLKVLDLSRVLAGPWCTQMLADLGADVIKVERPGGDPGRMLGPFPGDVAHPEKSGTFFYFNTNKRSIELDLASTADREALWRAETPQIFARDVLQEAFARWKGGLATDEAQMVTAAGYEVRVVQAAHWNPKVTYPADLELLERVIGRRR